MVLPMHVEAKWLCIAEGVGGMGGLLKHTPFPQSSGTWWNNICLGWIIKGIHGLEWSATGLFLPPILVSTPLHSPWFIIMHPLLSSFEKEDGILARLPTNIPNESLTCLPAIGPPPFLCLSRRHTTRPFHWEMSKASPRDTPVFHPRFSSSPTPCLFISAMIGPLCCYKV